MDGIHAMKNTASTSGKVEIGSHWGRVAYPRRLRRLFLIFAIAVALVSLVAGTVAVLAGSSVALGLDDVSSTYSYTANGGSRSARLLGPSAPLDTPTAIITPAGPATATNTPTSLTHSTSTPGTIPATTPAGSVTATNTPTSTPTGPTSPASNTPTFTPTGGTAIVTGTPTGPATATSTPPTATTTSTPQQPGSISGTIFANATETPNTINGAYVYACRSDDSFCSETQVTEPNGQYTFNSLPPGEYYVHASAPDGSNLQPNRRGPLTLPPGVALIDQHIVLYDPVGPPPGTTIEPSGDSGGIPVVSYGATFTIVTTGCTGGTATYQIYQYGLSVRGPLVMPEGPDGTYTAAVNPLNTTGPHQIVISIDCPVGGITTTSFNIYIDPSGFVRTVEGDPIPGAMVTLYRADSSDGPFEIVPDGSGIMSPSNRQNPDLTDADGHFGWDVIAGYYFVRAEHEGFVDPNDPTHSYVDSYIMQIPPPVTDLDLRLAAQCVQCPTRTPINTPTLPPGGPSPTPTHTPTTSAPCSLYPIALSAQSLAGKVPGDVVDDILNGVGGGNIGWLTWTGSTSESVLARSLTPPGDSNTYVNPHNPSDHTVSIGDWVQGKPGVSDGSGVRTALDQLKTLDIIVPVLDVVQGNGSNSEYQVASFAAVRLLDYHLPGQNRITARFMGYRSCP
jgi:hypothetical protein